ncbi:cation-transporting ATPase; E1-E2 ATPase [Synechocystis sp. PCC 6803]|uniref:Cation-transporting ATPase E1-E2 ATPase n=1 Tax=Synechocystis sp. (strain ATCC 27184 / PCC 6803 / Kazusa) TaxID=1111708 RepID=P74062_SYNY3|nr:MULTISPECIES: cation-transporting P-type ATPase [unclassified Synechocystis]BAM51888.1 cation-transporting ATPase E1-E2 ATPase [Synechocystis sp. PCC 6803] [Bacillus subtilis BEST7613]AGF51826.1 cation-transporting ATPase E1-E2 ATPase [Synechocystis sp. PCC 6803]ALJ67801.1 magnesium-transporting ATPase [Synechocystis sp. PCC 6803]AVP89631.1 magnesium-transporting ATPase [Synechocystis sp. IPPAS B-1465]MBD2618770.1 cation-transporting P-type ATPase [Synechocystis sp. FACHB-898]
MSDPDVSVSPVKAEAWYSYGIDKTLHRLTTAPHRGLAEKTVMERRRTYGLNEITTIAGRNNWQILLDQFTNVMLLMLIGVAIISGALDLISLRLGEETMEGFPFKDTIAIFAIVILNGLLGYFQESRAEKALAALKKMASPKVQVLRDGDRQEIKAASLVPGDIILLEAGSQLCADGQLIEAANLLIRESALTGEAQPVEKNASNTGLPLDTPLGDRQNMVFSGTEVVQGRGKVVITNTGMATELGKIAEMLQRVAPEPTPLQKRMENLAGVLVSGSLLLVTLVIILGVWQSGWGELRQLVETSLSMAVAVVPEGLPAVITVTLALGTQRMIKRHALIRKLPAVETLGSVNVICSDKTGTLTQNKMVVREVLTHGDRLSIGGEGYQPQGNIIHLSDGEQRATSGPWPPALQLLCLNAILCNDSELNYNPGEMEWQVIGDPTEGALLVLAKKFGFDQAQLRPSFMRRGEFPFSSERKRMGVIVEVPAEGESPLANLLGILENLALTPGPYLIFSKGSPELLLPHCGQIHTADHCVPLNFQHQEQILSDNNLMASRGLRVLGFACKSLAQIPSTPDLIAAEDNLVWLGMVGMLDAPRPEVRLAVEKSLAAGIRTVMITGDHPLTALAIAKDLGINQAGDRFLTGQTLEQLQQSDLEAQVEEVSVFARVSPEHKLRIVKAFQARNRFVAMTGDGVNDAPALKQADIGIAMGITGTDVSKEASDMVLLDDNFATIVAAAEEGRVVYNNIRNFIKYILGSNVGEVITIASAPLLGLSAVPLTPLQILWMNLVTDGLPALALAMEPGEPNIMKRRPFSPQESIFSRGLGAYIIRIGLVFAVVTITLMVWAYHSADLAGAPDSWKTMVFTTLCIAQMGHAIAVRSNHRLTIEMNPLTNPYLWGAVIVTTILQLCLVYFEPLRNFFGTDWLSPQQLLVCFGFSSLMFVWVELEKLLARFIK